MGTEKTIALFALVENKLSIASYPILFYFFVDYYFIFSPLTNFKGAVSINLSFSYINFLLLTVTVKEYISSFIIFAIL